MDIQASARRNRKCWAALCVLATTLSSIAAVPPTTRPATRPAEAKEPPLELLLEVGGRSTPIKLDEPAEVQVNGRKVPVRLTAKPYRLFEIEGVRFKYPRHCSFEFNDDDPDATIWTLDGNDNVIMLMRYEQMPTQMVLRAVETAMVEQYKKNLKNRSEVSIRLADRDLKGRRLEIEFADQHLRQDWYAFSASRFSFVLMIQDFPKPDGNPSDETARAVALLKGSFQIKAPATRPKD